MTLTVEQLNREICEPPRLRQLSKDVAMRAAGRLGVCLNAIFGERAAGTMGIVTYHRVSEHVTGLPAPMHNVQPRRFREQLAGLKRRGFSFWPLSKALDYHARGQQIPPRTLLVTFDDGFQTVYTEAWPVLKELQIPATVFVNTAFLDSSDPFWFDAWGVAHCDRAPSVTYRPLTTDQCSEMAESGLVEIGAHTHTHEDFRGRPDAFRDDLQTSIDFVRSWFGVRDVTFAFPFGGRHTGFASDELADAARQTDAICGLTTESVLVPAGTDPFRWGRFNAFPWDSSATLAAKVSGWYSWAPQLKQQIATVLTRRGGAAETTPRSFALYEGTNG